VTVRGTQTLIQPNRQIRSLVLYVDLVGSRPIWPAHVGSLIGPDGSRRIVWMIKRMIKRQGAEIPGHPDHGDRWWSGHQIFHLVTAVDCHTAAMTTDLNQDLT
jgi:hypothetical protein